MPVQDHPQYNEWSDALDKLKEANDFYRAASIARLEPHSVESLRFNLDHCQAEFNKIARQVDA